MTKHPVVLLVGGMITLMIVMGVGRFAYTPILPFMQKELNLSEDMAGYLASSNYLGYLVGALLAGMIRWKSRKVPSLRFSLLLNIGTTAAMGFSSNFILWAILRFFSGLTSGLVFVLVSSLVLDVFVSMKRSAWSGFFYGGVGLGISITGILVPLFGNRYGWQGTWLGLAVVCLLVGFFAWIWVVEEQTQDLTFKNQVRQNVNSTLLPWLVVAYGCEGLGYIITGTFLVTIVDQIPQLHNYASLTWIFVGIAAMPSCFLWSWMAKKWGYIPSLILAYILQAMGVILPVIFVNVTGTLVGAFLFGGTFMGITTLAVSYARQLFPERSNQIIGYLTTVYGIGQMAGPSLAGALAAKSHDFTTSLLVASLVLIIGICIFIIGVYWMGNRIDQSTTNHKPEG